MPDRFITFWFDIHTTPLRRTRFSYLVAHWFTLRAAGCRLLPLGCPFPSPLPRFLGLHAVLLVVGPSPFHIPHRTHAVTAHGFWLLPFGCCSLTYLPFIVLGILSWFLVRVSAFWFVTCAPHRSAPLVDFTHTFWFILARYTVHLVCLHSCFGLFFFSFGSSSQHTFSLWFGYMLRFVYPTPRLVCYTPFTQVAAHVRSLGRFTGLRYAHCGLHTFADTCGFILFATSAFVYKTATPCRGLPFGYSTFYRFLVAVCGSRTPVFTHALPFLCLPFFSFAHSLLLYIWFTFTAHAVTHFHHTCVVAVGCTTCILTVLAVYGLVKLRWLWFATFTVTVYFTTAGFLSLHARISHTRIRTTRFALVLHYTRYLFCFLATHFAVLPVVAVCYGRSLVFVGFTHAV